MEKLLLQFRVKESQFGVTRKTVRKLADTLGLSETETTLLALARMRDTLIPAYPEDDGPLTEKQLAAIRKLAPQAGFKPTRSLIEGI
ncbi:MAG: hypothetical protein ACRES4_03455 [Nevskiales bacterium]